MKKGNKQQPIIRIQHTGEYYYTSGLSTYKNSCMELEIKLGIIQPTTAIYILTYFANIFLSGIVVKDKECIEDSRYGELTWFARTIGVNNKPVIRIILSDPQNLPPWDKKCHKIYKRQWTKQNEIDMKLIEYSDEIMEEL